MAKTREVKEINRSLSEQVSFLSEIARKQHIPILIANQVYANFEDKGVNLVGGDILKYGSKCLIELKKDGDNVRTAILQKHRSLPEKKEIKFKIVEKGFNPL